MWLTNLLQNAWYLFLIIVLIGLSVLGLVFIETLISTKIQELKVRRCTKKHLKIALKQYEKQMLKQHDEMVKDVFKLNK